MGSDATSVSIPKKVARVKTDKMTGTISILPPDRPKRNRTIERVYKRQQIHYAARVADLPS